MKLTEIYIACQGLRSVVLPCPPLYPHRFLYNKSDGPPLCCLPNSIDTPQKPALWQRKGWPLRGTERHLCLIGRLVKGELLCLLPNLPIPVTTIQTAAPPTTTVIARTTVQQPVHNQTFEIAWCRHICFPIDHLQQASIAAQFLHLSQLAVPIVLAQVSSSTGVVEAIYLQAMFAVSGAYNWSMLTETVPWKFCIRHLCENILYNFE